MCAGFTAVCYHEPVPHHLHRSTSWCLCWLRRPLADGDRGCLRKQASCECSEPLKNPHETGHSLLQDVCEIRASLEAVPTPGPLTDSLHFPHLPSRSALRSAFLLLLLISATWLLGLMAVNSDVMTFHYLFAIFSCLQVGLPPQSTVSFAPGCLAALYYSSANNTLDPALSI